MGAGWCSCCWGLWWLGSGGWVWLHRLGVRRTLGHPSRWQQGRRHVQRHRHILPAAWLLCHPCPGYIEHSCPCQRVWLMSPQWGTHPAPAHQRKRKGEAVSKIQEDYPKKAASPCGLLIKWENWENYPNLNPPMDGKRHWVNEYSTWIEHPALTPVSRGYLTELAKLWNLLKSFPSLQSSM